MGWKFKKQKRDPDRVDALAEAIQNFMGTGQMIDEISGIPRISENIGLTGYSVTTGMSGYTTYFGVTDIEKPKKEFKFGR